MSSKNYNNEHELLSRLANSDEQAFRSLFDIYKIQLFSFVIQFTHSAADAEEIVQESFLKLWENRSTLNQVNHPRNYIYTIARNNTLNYLNKAARNDKLLKQVWVNMKKDDNSTDEILAAKESKQLIEDAVSQLSEQKQQIFRMSRHEGMNHEEIARQLNLSRSRVKNILVETLKYIRAYLELHSVTLALLFSLTTTTRS